MTDTIPNYISVHLLTEDTGVGDARPPLCGQTLLEAGKLKAPFSWIGLAFLNCFIKGKYFDTVLSL